jgi:hypothetical protein
MEDVTGAIHRRNLIRLPLEIKDSKLKKRKEKRKEERKELSAKEVIKYKRLCVCVGPGRPRWGSGPCLELDRSSQKRLKQIRDLMKPFEEHTLFVSREEPTLHRLPNLYHHLEKLLLSIVMKEGVYAMYDSSLLEATQKGLD